MATYVSRPAWAPRVRSLATAWILVPVGLGLLVALSLGVKDAELNVGYWVDEGLSVGIADRPLTDIPGVLRQDGSPPLYYGLLHIWMSLAGSDEKATHTLSLLFALAAVPVAFWGAGLVFGRRAAWFAAVLATLNPYISQYAQETRMYSLVVLLSLLAARCTCAPTRPTSAPRGAGRSCSGSRSPPRSTPTTGRCSSASRCSSPGSGCSRWRRRPSAGGGCATARSASGSAALLYLPWVPTLLFQAAHTGAPWSRKPGYEDLTMEATHRLLGQRRGSCSWSRPGAARSRSCGRGGAGS